MGRAIDIDVETRKNGGSVVKIYLFCAICNCVNGRLCVTHRIYSYLGVSRRRFAVDSSEGSQPRVTV